MQKAAIYTPYLDTVGGGEKYMLTIAEALTDEFKVDILLDKHLQSFDKQKLKDKIIKFHQIDLSKMNFVDAPLHTGQLLRKAIFLKEYAVLFYLSDGSIFHTTSKNSFLHFQMPLGDIQSGGLLNNFKLSSWKEAVYNSEFTRQNIKKLKIKGRVIYPPVDIDRFTETPKKKQIINVGRFMGEGIKKQHILINAFIDLIKKHKLSGWSLHLAGSLDNSDEEYLNELKRLAKSQPIFFYPNLTYQQVSDLYQQSSIYWHAMGFEERDLDRFEHFGISTVEAMAACCVPVVINKGGQMEIVEHGKTGYLWNSLEELDNYTLKLINSQNVIDKMGKIAKNSVQRFSKNNFKKSILNLVHEY